MVISSKFLKVLFSGIYLFVGFAARADDLKDIEVHAFLSQGFIKTTANNYLVNSKLGSFDFTEGGINLTKQLSDNLRTGLQLFSSRLGDTNSSNSNVKLDWFYLDYHATDLLGFRFGRIKIPFGLYNDIVDVDAARAPVLLPQSVYPAQNRNYLLAQNGFEAYGHTATTSAGGLDYAAYAGTITVDIPNTVGSSAQIQSLDIPYVGGARVFWETPEDGLRVGATVQTLRLDTTVLAGGSATSASIYGLLWVGSVEYIKNDLLLAAEYSNTRARIANSTNTALYPDISQVTANGYVMAAYRLSKWLQPALYYSVSVPNTDFRSGSQSRQDDISATLRFDVNPFWLVKLEGHYMRGTAGLSSTLNNGTPVNSLDDHWGVFLVKTTAYF